MNGCLASPRPLPLLTSPLPLSLQLNLSKNQLCGLNLFGQGIYTSEGIKAIANVLEGNGSLMSLDVTYNQLGEEGRAMVSDAVKGREGFTLKLKGDFE